MTTRKYIFGVDPGKNTGYAVLHAGINKFIHEGQADQSEFCHFAELFLSKHGEATHVICESFIITMATAKNSQAPWSLEIIGVMRYLSEKYGAEFALRSPADAKRFSTDDKLKNVGWYVPGRRHLNDALRHVLITAVENGVVSPRDLV